MTYLTEKEVEKQNALTKERLKLFTPRIEHDSPNRPKENLIDLMHWTKDTFGAFIKKDNLHCWIHNKIVIDGSFLQFAEENNINIECLYRDSIASWESEEKYEHFMAQGVFLITYKKLKFIHAALFHKGNQNEDEVSFFVIMSDNDYEEYLKVRNWFSNWLVERDRKHLEIHVVGGNGLQYEKNLSWNDLFLPDTIKNSITGMVEGFLASKSLYEKKKIAWKKGALFYGPAGNGKSSCIRTIISNYDFKPVTVNSGQRTNDDTMTEAFEYAESQGPSFLYIEDLDTLLNGSVSISHFLNLMDGVSSRSGIFVIATANDLSKMNEAVINRPSRFDRKILFPLPNSEMTKKYLKYWFGKSLKPNDIKNISVQTVEYGFSYAYLKELYLSSAYNAISNNREDPNMEDINKALEQLIFDRNNVLNGFKNNNKVIGIGDGEFDYE